MNTENLTAPDDIESCPTCSSTTASKLMVTSPEKTQRRCRDEWHQKWKAVPNRADVRAARKSIRRRGAR